MTGFDLPPASKPNGAPKGEHSPITGAGRIVRADAILLSIPFQSDAKPVWSFTEAAKTSFDTLLVRIETSNGLVGWGEAFSRNEDRSLKLLIETRIFPLILGRDASEIGRIKRDLEFGLQNFGRVGPTMYGIAAVDIALWDIAGKAADRPLVDLLGGRFTDTVEVYASLLRYDTCAGVRRATRQAINEGYRAIKLHETNYDEIAAAADEAKSTASGAAAVMLDVNCPWSVAQALRMDAQLADLGLTWLEEPVWPPENYRGLARVRATGRHRIAAGENAGSLHDFAAMIEAGAIDIAQPDVAKAGGLSELLKIAALCEASAVEFVPHCALFGPGQVATLHLNAAQPEVPMLERLYCQFEAELYAGAMTPRDGRLPVPDGPGLGLEPDPDVIRTFAVA